MQILAKAGREDIAVVYIAEMGGKKIEFVESIQPPLPREKKWVLIISSLFGCPVDCKFCDAGGKYEGLISKEGLIKQIDFMIKNRYPDGKVPSEKFKIQFARMGEPAFNPNIIDVLRELPDLYDIKGFIPSVSTIAPSGCDKFFEELLVVKKEMYDDKFQLQFSIHSTDEAQRNSLIPVKKWLFQDISNYGDIFYSGNGRKITLNFALAEENIVKKETLLKYFSPEKFLIKITPVNPTYKALKNSLTSAIKTQNEKSEIAEELKKAGYDVILSVGELEENNIGSNCGQYINRLEESLKLENSYTYDIKSF